MENLLLPIPDTVSSEWRFSIAESKIPQEISGIQSECVSRAPRAGSIRGNVEMENRKNASGSSSRKQWPEGDSVETEAFPAIHFTDFI